MYSVVLAALLILVARQWMAGVPKPHEVDPRIPRDYSEGGMALGKLVVCGLIVVGVLLFLGVI